MTTDDGIRLAKRVAEILPCSRAEAERYIAGGWVSVDGAAVEDPATRVTAAQHVELLPGATADDPAPVTILLHKPAGFDTSAAMACLRPETLAQDGQGGQRVLKRHFTKLTLATPLETSASGLLVFSQDWRVLRKLVDDSKRVEQEYVAEVTGAIAEGGLERLNAGGRPDAPLKASWQSEARLRFAGKAILPGQIERLCAKVGLNVSALRRLRVGRISVASLPSGSWRYLNDYERF
jgi:23S rRNA pseudouridine2604 synthase